MPVERDAGTYSAVYAPGGPPPNDWFFSNDRGTWSIKKNVGVGQGQAGSGIYVWFDGSPNNDTLEFIRAGVISRPEGDHLGWTYKAVGQNFWFFFSYTALYFDGVHTYYPLYYSFQDQEQQFKRFLTQSWTFGIKTP